MANEIKFTETEQKEINDLRLEVSGVFTQLGQLSIERQRRLKEVDDLVTQLTEKHSQLVETEQELFKRLNEKYGDGNYDPETGIFTPVEKVHADPQPENVK